MSKHVLHFAMIAAVAAEATEVPVAKRHAAVTAAAAAAAAAGGVVILTLALNIVTL